MIATILSFAISLILLAGLLGYKIVLIRRGENMIEEEHSIHSFIPEHINFGRLKADVVEYGKKSGHVAVLILLKVWIKTMYFVKRKKEYMIPKIKSWIPKKHRDIKSPPVLSDFLQNISTYKTKLQKIKDKMREEEEKNI